MDKKPADKKPYLIMVCSQKGGVGKTTVAINLAIALMDQGYKVLLIDADIATCSINEHMGIKLGGAGFADAISGKATISDAIFAYEPIDLHLILGSATNEVYKPTTDDINKFCNQITKMDYEFIIMDSPPGLFDNAYAKFVNDVLIVTTPDAPSASSNAKLSAYCQKLRLPYRLVINRAGNSKFELQKEDVERLFGDVAYEVVPEDEIVTESLSKHTPVYILDKGSPFSYSVEKLSRVYLLKVGEPVQDRGSSKGHTFFQRLAGWAIGGAKDNKK